MLEEAIDELLRNKEHSVSYSAWHQKMCENICALYEGITFINKEPLSVSFAIHMEIG